MKTGFIYTLIDPANEQVRYVGQTVDLKKRYCLHLYWAKKRDNKTHKEKWIASLLRNNIEPVMEVIWQGDARRLNEKEIQYIKLFKSVGAKLTNATIGGETTTGRKCSDETKAKLSAMFKGRKPPFEVTEEWKQKVRLARGQIKHTNESKRKLSEARKGKPSFWTNNEMPEQMKNRIRELGRKAGKPVIAIKEGVTTEYPSINEAHKKTGCDRKDIRSVLNGIYRQIKGYSFKYK